MINFADRLIHATKAKGNPCVVGIDFHEKLLPPFVKKRLEAASTPDAVRDVISGYIYGLLDVIAPLVPAIKIQVSLLEPFTFVGAAVLVDVIWRARQLGLLTIADAKRSDIASSAEGYAKAFLEGNEGPGSWRGYGADAVTLNGFLGRDSLEPFVEKCSELGKGCFVLVKTSNKGSGETQDQELVQTGEPVFALYSQIVDEIGQGCIGKLGYSSVGAVVGATHPSQAVRIRGLLPRTPILVPGYGAQGATSDDVALCFNSDGLGAIVNASRSITYEFGSAGDFESDYHKRVFQNVARMIEDIGTALARSLNSRLPSVSSRTEWTGPQF